MSTTFASDAPFYVGTYTYNGKSKGIYVGRLDTESGKLGPLDLVAEVKNPSFLALSPDGKRLYSVIDERGGAVGAFSVGEAGRLTPLGQMPSGGSGACHVWVDATGTNVFVANYSSGSIAAFRAGPEGALGERTAFVQFTGTGPNKARQEKPHAHSIYADAANRFVYSCDLGTDNVWIFKLEAEAGTLTPTEPPSGKVPPGAGPRHLAIHPNDRFAYAVNEMGLTVTAFSRNPETGALDAMQTIPTLPADAATEGVSTAEIFCHPTGKWLYASNRGHDSIAVYAIAPDGKLTAIQNAPADVRVPRGFAIDPAGRWMVTAGQKDNRIAVLKIDLATGKLTSTGQSAEVGAPVCILFAPPRF